MGFRLVILAIFALGIIGCGAGETPPLPKDPPKETKNVDGANASGQLGLNPNYSGK